MEAAFAAALLDPGQPQPPGITTARGLPDRLRFAVYRNNVHVGLTEALAAAYPVTRRIVGVDFFHAMAGSYIALRKPRSPVLIRYGEDFPAFVAGFPPAAALPYLGDVARLEQARLSAYHAAEAVPLDGGRLARWEPERLMSAGLVVHPAVRLVRSNYAIGSIWQSHQFESAGKKILATPGEAVLIVRPEATVSLTILPPQDVDFVQALLAGLAIADAVALADRDCDAGRALAGLIRLGAVVALSSAQEEPS